MPSEFLLLLCALCWASSRAQDPACWNEQFTEEKCCTPKPGGNPACWDGSFTFDRCCGFHAPVGSPSARALTDAGGNPACWSGTFTEEVCCDLHQGPDGSPSCWNPLLGFTFDICCPHYAAGIIAAPGVRAPPPAPTLADGCMIDDIGQWYLCCLSTETSCFKDSSNLNRTYDLCCSGVQKFRDIWYHVPFDDPLAKCWFAIQRSTNHPQAQCINRGDRFFYISVPTSKRMDHPIWWQFLSGVCVPRACDDDSAAGWLSYRLDSWHPGAWPYETAKKLNSTHIQLPPHRARRRPYQHFEWTWIAVLPTAEPKNIGQDFFEFAMLEYHSLLSWKPSPTNLVVLGAFISLVSLGGILHCGGLRSRLAASSPLNALWRLGEPRGPRRFDAWRLLFCMLVVAENVQMHYPFQRDTGLTHGLFRLFNCMSQNHALAALMVYLSVHRRQEPSSADRKGVFSYLYDVLVYAARRWIAIIPFISFWTWVHLSVLMEDIPLHNTIRSNFVYLWFVIERAKCSSASKLLPSLFFVNIFVNGKWSVCHNIGVFESYCNVDMLTFALNRLIPPRQLGFVAAVIWVYYAASHPSAGHNNIVSAGLASLVVIGALRHMTPFRRRTHALALGVASLGAGMLLEDIKWFYTATLVSIYGLFVLLDQPFSTEATETKEQEPKRRSRWSLLSALARLSAGVNLANLFVIGLHRGLEGSNSGIGADDFELPDSVTIFFQLFFRVGCFSLVAALLVFLLIEHPITVLLFGARDTGRHAKTS